MRLCRCSSRVGCFGVVDCTDRQSDETPPESSSALSRPRRRVEHPCTLMSQGRRGGDDGNGGGYGGVRSSIFERGYSQPAPHSTCTFATNLAGRGAKVHGGEDTHSRCACGNITLFDIICRWTGAPLSRRWTSVLFLCTTPHIR